MSKDEIEDMIELLEGYKVKMPTFDTEFYKKHKKKVDEYIGEVKNRSLRVGDTGRY